MTWSQPRPPESLVPEPAPRPRHARRMLLIAPGLASLPLAWELAQLCAARWAILCGRSLAVQTPVLTFLTSLGTTLLKRALASIGHCLHDLPWDPRGVIALGIVLAMLLILPLRKGP